MEIGSIEKEIPYQDAFGLYSSMTRNGKIPALLMESRTINLAYGRQSLIASNLALKITGKNESFRIEALTEQGLNMLSEFSEKDFPFATSYSRDSVNINGTFNRYFDPNQDLSERIRSINVSKFLRATSGKFQTENPYAGLYGAFAYDFVRNFEAIGNVHDKEPGEDFILFVPTEIYVFDDIKEKGTHHILNIKGSKKPFKDYQLKIGHNTDSKKESMSEEEYAGKVASIISDIKNGRFMQCVLSRSISIPLVEHPLNSYQRLRDINPSPYCFFFNFGNGQFLYGSSPEIHALVENNTLTIRPLAGTVPRSKNPLDDAELRIKLLTDPKERSEHMMLVDLARNDVSRMCKSGSIRITDLLTVEEYPNLHHLASGVQGKLNGRFDSIDSLLTTIPAGTLSGAPKLEAMKAIEQLEKTRRGFYGGAVGYVIFNGDCNTGITIRSVYVNDGFSTVQAGAGIVLDSVPEKEVAEVRLKLEKPLKNLEAGLK